MAVVAKYSLFVLSAGTLLVSTNSTNAITCGDPVTQAFQERSKLDVGP